MQFPQDRRRRPPAAAALPPALLLLLLLLPPAAAAPLPAGDFSGEAELEEAAVRLARLLHARAAQLKEEVGTGGGPGGPRGRLLPAKV